MSAGSALETAAAVRAGERSAREVIDESLAAIDEANADLNAFLCVTADEARAAADAVDAQVAAGDDPGPLAGVPIALKDNLVTRGVPTSCASRILAGWVPPYDATVVQRLRAAGVSLVTDIVDEPYGQRHFFCHDVDGVLIDVIERIPIDPAWLKAERARGTTGV